MKSSIIGACLLLAFPLAVQASGTNNEQARSAALLKTALPEVRLADADSPGLADQLVGRWERSLREARGWDDGAISHFRTELKGMPSDTLRKALETKNWDTLQSILISHQGEATSARLAEAVEHWRSGTTLDETDPEMAKLKKSVMKALGDADRDLVYIPIQPCTTWDTRFASPGVHAGQITATANKPGYVYHSAAGPFDWSSYGGNPSCAGTAVVADYGVIPYAVAYTLYTANATANGWVTAYRDTDPDPSSATISLYYTPGPTLSTTVVTRVGRAIAGGYDIRVASQFGSVDVAVSVIGYFIKSAATALDCTTVTGTGIDVAAGSTRLWGGADAACAAGYTATGCNFFNTTATTNHVQVEQQFVGAGCGFDIANVGGTLVTVNPTARCCRVPGR